MDQKKRALLLLLLSINFVDATSLWKRPEDSVQASVPSFYRVGPWDRTQVIRAGGKRLNPCLVL